MRLTLPCMNALFREASRGLERKLSHIIWRHPMAHYSEEGINAPNYLPKHIPHGACCKISNRAMFLGLASVCVKPVWFRMQNAPYPALHECFFAKDRVDWKERYRILFEDILLSNFCKLGSILSQRYPTKNPCSVGWGRFCTQNRVEIASKFACVNGLKVSKSVSRQQLPNPKLMLLYDLTRWLISSHVGSLFQFRLCAYWIFTIVTRLASPLRLILVVKRGGKASYIGAVSFRRIIHVRTDPASIRRIPHRACCFGEPANVFRPCLGLRKCQNP